MSALPQLLTVAEVAERLAVSQDFVYRHADELGGVRLGGGLKPRLRFDEREVAEYVRACSNSRRTDVGSNASVWRGLHRGGPGQSGRDSALLPVERGATP